MTATGETSFAGVIGDPVRHSLSPALHNAAYAHLGLDRVYGAFEVPATDFAAAVAGARALGFKGLSVTMPHKEEAARLADRRSVTARRLGAANTLTFDGRGSVADSTDGGGLIDDLAAALDFDMKGRVGAVIGAGGAARAVVLALHEAGAAEVLVVNRTAIRAFRAAALAPRIGRVARAEELGEADLVVQATPVGMGVGASASAGTGSTIPAGPEWPAGVDPSALGAGQIAVDLIYHPATTRWLAEAAKAGARVRGGLGTLVHQAARQIAIWTGEPAPIDVMWDAVGGDPAHSEGSTPGS